MLKYVAVDDCGNQINPLIVEGQVHGGVIQGLAQALFEEAVYDDDGNLRTSTLADYLVPAASDVPSLDHSATPSRRARRTRSGSRASARRARSAPTPAVINAVVDALSPLGVTDVADAGIADAGLVRHPGRKSAPDPLQNGTEVRR